MARVALASCDPYPPVSDDEGPLRDAFRACGVDVVAPAWDADFPWHSVDLILLRTTWDYHVRHREFLAWCERVATVTRLVHAPRIVRWNIDKRYLRDLSLAGIPIADTAWLLPRDPLPERLPERGFLKPIIGANAHATLRFEGAARADIDAFRAGHADLGGFILQPYLRSVETEGELSAIVIAGRFAHGVQKIPAAGDYRVQEDWGARDVPWRPDAEDVALAERVVAAAATVVSLPIIYGRVDFLRDDRGQLLVNELELVEPALFFRHAPESAARLAEAVFMTAREAAARGLLAD